MIQNMKIFWLKLAQTIVLLNWLTKSLTQKPEEPKLLQQGKTPEILGEYD